MTFVNGVLASEGHDSKRGVCARNRAREKGSREFDGIEQKLVVRVNLLMRVKAEASSDEDEKALP